MITALSLLLLVFIFGVWEVIRRRRDVAPLLSLALLLYLLLWNAWPLLYGATALDWTESLADRGRYQHVVIAHLSVLFATLLAFVLLPSRVWRPLAVAFGRTPTSPRTALHAAAIATVVFFLGSAYAFQARGGSYGSAVAFVMTASTGEAARVGMVDAISTLAFTLALAVLVGSWRSFSVPILALGWAAVGVQVLFSVLQGIRAVILLPGIVLAAQNWQAAREGRPTHWKLIMLVLAATLFAAPLLAAAMGAIRLTGSGQLDADAVRQGYDLAVANLTPAERARLAARELNTKFDSYSTAAVLLDSDGIGSAGWRPYSSALLSPIPRLLLPTKPVPTSKDGQNAGIPYRVAAEQFGAVEAGMVVPVSPAGIAMWELGHAGLALVVVMNLLLLLTSNTLLAAPSLFARAIGVAMLSLPTTEFLFGAPSGLVRDLLRYALYLVLLWLVTQSVSLMRSLPRAIRLPHGAGAR